jgi:hypothetical protein
MSWTCLERNAMESGHHWGAELQDRMFCPASRLYSTPPTQCSSAPIGAGVQFDDLYNMQKSLGTCLEWKAFGDFRDG